MSDNIVDFTGITKAIQPPEKILEAAKHQGLEWVLVIGRTPDAELYFAGNISDVAEINLMLDEAKKEILP